MKIDRRLDAWMRDGIIDGDAAARIRAYEEEQRRPMALYALVGLGALAVGVGIIAIVAANWELIPAWVKLGADLALGLGLVAAIHRYLRPQSPLISEALLILYYLFVLASIGLLGQVYQTGSPLSLALAVWSLATLPLLFFTRSTFAGTLWAAGLVTTYAVSAVELIERAPGGRQPDLTLTVSVALPMLLLLSGWALRRTSVKAALVFEGLAWQGIVLGSFSACFVWYVQVDAGDVTWGGIAALALCMAPVALAKPLFGDKARVAIGSLGVALAATLFPILLPHDEWRLVGGVASLLVLGYFAFAAWSVGHRGAFSTLTAALGIRIVVVYFEVFGSLMSTGLGLITGGVLSLLLAWLWARSSARLKSSFDAEGEHV